jgi:hypothetical protein
MDLIVNSRIIAAVEFCPVQLGQLLGAFELIIPFSGTVHAAADGIQRSLSISGARIAMRRKNGQTVQLGRAVPDNGTLVHQNGSPGRADFTFKLTLQPYQLEALESERDGGDLHLTIALQARAASSDQPGGHWEQYLADEPPRDSRRLFDLSYAAISVASCIA